jgi:hypothetical protein
LLIAATMGLLIIDVATRRIAWDFGAMLHWFAGAFPLMASFFTIRRINPESTMDSLYRARWLREHPEAIREHGEYRPTVETTSIHDASRTSAAVNAVEPLPASRFDARSRAKLWLEKKQSSIQTTQSQKPEVNS